MPEKNDESTALEALRSHPEMVLRPEDFAVAVRGLRAAGFRGMNVTQPHKLAAFAVCEESARTRK